MSIGATLWRVLVFAGCVVCSVGMIRFLDPVGWLEWLGTSVVVVVVIYSICMTLSNIVDRWF